MCIRDRVMTLGSLSVDGNDQNAIGFIVGGNSDLRYVMNGDCIYGGYFNKTEVEAGRSVCIIDSTSAMPVSYTHLCRREYSGADKGILSQNRAVCSKIQRRNSPLYLCCLLYTSRCV